MIAILRRQHREAFSIHADAAQLAEVRIAAWRLAHAAVPQGAALFIETQDVRDVARPFRDLALQRAGREIVEIEVAPVVALGEPEHLVRRGQHAPVGHAVAGLVLRGHRLTHDVAHGTSHRVGDAERRLLVIA